MNKTAKIARLEEIRQEIHNLIDEAIEILPKENKISKLSGVYWFSSIKQALGYRSEDSFEYTYNDALADIRNLEGNSDAPVQ